MQKQLEKLQESFRESAQQLRGLDHYVQNRDEKHILNTQFSLERAFESAGNQSIESAAEALSLFQDYVHDKALLGTDKLTNLPNRSAFDEQLKTAIKKHGTPVEQPVIIDAANQGPDRRQSEQVSNETNNYFALIIMDLDRFKGLNDDYGHDCGDEALQAFAKHLNKTIRADNDNHFEGRSRAARLGGDEFTLILNTHANSAQEAKSHFTKALKRIRSSLEGVSFSYEDKTFPIVSTAGMHILTKKDTAHTAYQKADSALHQAKSDKVERYNKTVEILQERGAPNLQIVEDKRGAENEENLKQRIYDAVEALAKNNTPIKVQAHSGVLDALAILERAGVNLEYEAPDTPSEDNTPPELG